MNKKPTFTLDETTLSPAEESACQQAMEWAGNTKNTFIIIERPFANYIGLFKPLECPGFGEEDTHTYRYNEQDKQLIRIHDTSEIQDVIENILAKE